jgi:bacterioferritin-associated ferredoxin
MIICSCNVISDHQVRAAMGTAAPPRSLGEFFRQLGKVAPCGRCAPSVKLIMEGSGAATGVKGKRVGAPAKEFEGQTPLARR